MPFSVGEALGTISLPQDLSQQAVALQGVGKSCLVLRYVRGQFDPSSKVTVGAAFMSHSVHLQDGTTVKFEIWYSPASQCRVPSNETSSEHHPEECVTIQGSLVVGALL